MEPRKYHLQQQIIEALKAKDNDLYSLLKSQWAHRFGVESLEELQNLDLSLLDQKSISEDNQINDQLQDSSFKVDKETSVKDDDNEEEVTINDTKKVVDSVKVENKHPVKFQSAEIVDTEDNLNNNKNPVIEYKSLPKVKALIPLPPKPKYGYYKKWLLSS